MAPGSGTSAVRLVTTRNGNGRVVRVPLTTSESLDRAERVRIRACRTSPS
jgi:hypothetical protein